MKFIGSLFTSFVLLLVGSPALKGEEGKARIEVNLPRKAVIGLPIPIHLRIFGPFLMPKVDLGTNINPFEMDFVSDGKMAHFPVSTNRKMNDLGGDYEHTQTSLRYDTIIAGQSREYVVDLSRLQFRVANGALCVSEMEDSLILPGGRYTISLKPRGTLSSTARILLNRVQDAEVKYLNRTIELVSPNAAEQKFLQEIRNRHRERKDDRRIEPFMNSVWETFVCDNDSAFTDGALNELGTLAQEQLSYHVALGKAIRGQEISIEQGEFSRLYEAEIRRLQYWSAKAKGDKARASAIKEELLRLRPDMNDELLDNKAGSKSMLEWYQNLREERKKEKK